MKPVPRALLERLQQLASPGAEVVPLDWAFDGEDHNLAVFIDDAEAPSAIEDRLLARLYPFTRHSKPRQ